MKLLLLFSLIVFVARKANSCMTCSPPPTSTTTKSTAPRTTSSSSTTLTTTTTRKNGGRRRRSSDSDSTFICYLLDSLIESCLFDEDCQVSAGRIIIQIWLMSKPLQDWKNLYEKECYNRNGTQSNQNLQPFV